jgi:hypothetical protein
MSGRGDRTTLSFARFMANRTHSATMGSLDDIKPMRTMETDYTKTAFPEDPIPATFFGTSIYWRPENSSGQDNSEGSSDANHETSALAVPEEPKADDENDLVERLAATTIT